MKILHLVTSIDSGGVSTLLHNYCKNIDRSILKFEIAAIDKGHKQVFHEAFEALGVKIFYMPKNYMKRLIFIFNLIYHGKYDIVHCHIELPSAIYLTIAKILGVKIRIAHAHMAFLDYSSINNRILQTLLNHVATNRWGCSKEALTGLFGKKHGEKGTIIYNAIDVEKYSFSENIREEYRIKRSLEDKYVVGFIGRLTHQKNIFYLLNIFNELQRIKSNAVLLIVGSGEQEQQFIAKIKELNLEKKVHLLGVRHDVNYLMMAMDVLLLPSRWEGLGIVLIEAQAAALKCIASTKVPKSTRISPYIHYQSIGAAPRVWVDEIKRNCENYFRQPINEIIASNHYNITEEAHRLSEKYISLMKQKT